MKRTYLRLACFRIILNFIICFLPPSVPSVIIFKERIIKIHTPFTIRILCVKVKLSLISGARTHVFLYLCVASSNSQLVQQQYRMAEKVGRFCLSKRCLTLWRFVNQKRETKLNSGHVIPSFGLGLVGKLIQAVDERVPCALFVARGSLRKARSERL